MRLTFRAQAFGPLANVEWTIPPGVSAVVGPNRVGKSTLLALPEFIRTAIASSLNDAVTENFNGVAYLRNFARPPTSPCSVGFSVDEREWNVDIAISGGSIAPHCAETLRFAEKIVLSRAFGATVGDSEGREVPLGNLLLPRACSSRLLSGLDASNADLFEVLAEMDQEVLAQRAHPISADAATSGFMLAFHALSGLTYKTYHYQIQHLMKFGSVQSSSSTLAATAENVFPLLRNWRDRSETEARFDFVLSTLREAFPHVSRVDFEQAGQTVTMAIRDKRWPDKKVPISRESTGLVTALLQLCAVASCTPAGLVTIDELETSLHPHAIRVLIAAFRRWAKEHDLRIVLATQSETVLDQFHDDPGQIYVIEPGQETSPRSLTEMFDGEYLNQFSLGDLFSHLEFGSNREPPAGP